MRNGKILFRLSVIAGMLALAACEQKPEPPPALPKTEPAPKIFAPQRDALDRAKQVEGQMQEDANKRQEAIDEQAK